MANEMKRNPLSGTGKVFGFSIRQMCGSKPWLISTILIAALLLCGIPLLLLAVSAISAKDDTPKEDEAVIGTVFVVDETAGDADYSILKDAGYPDVSYTAYQTMDDAIAQAADTDDTVILRVTKPDAAYALTVYLPDDTELSRSKASKFASFAEDNFAAILMQKAKLTPEAVMLLSLPIQTETAVLHTDAESEDDDNSIAEEVLGALIPFFVLLTIYMMVVLYGQSMANSVMLEKTSKLMETILTAVHPVALMAGKLLATACAAVTQILIWLFSMIGGNICGVLIVLRFMPETDNTTVLAMNEAMESAMQISVPGILLSIVMLALGFLLYLSLAAVSGALASKTEDLNKTNIVFVLFIIVSFLLCISPSDADAAELSLLSDAMWLKIFPFTSILVMPGDLILGKISLGMGCISIAVLIISVALFVTLAAAVYKLLVLYRGEPPTPASLLRMFKEK